MAMDGLPEGVSPSGRVPEQLLQAAPILKRRRRWNKEGFAKKGSVSKGFRTRAKYRRGGTRGPTGQPGGPLARPRVGPRQEPSWLPAHLLVVGCSWFGCPEVNRSIKTSKRR